jgi:hypothetical protein
MPRVLDLIGMTAMSCEFVVILAQAQANRGNCAEAGQTGTSLPRIASSIDCWRHCRREGHEELG